MRSSIASPPCSFSNQPDATAIVYYRHEAIKTTPNTTAWQAWKDSVASTGPCGNDDLNKTVPWFPITPDPAPPTTKEIDITFGANDTGHFVWFMNNVSFRANYNQPILLLSNLGNNSFPDSPQWNVENFGSNSSIRIGTYLELIPLEWSILG